MLMQLFNEIKRWIHGFLRPKAVRSRPKSTKSRRPKAASRPKRAAARKRK